MPLCCRAVTGADVMSTPPADAAFTRAHMSRAPRYEVVLIFELYAADAIRHCFYASPRCLIAIVDDDIDY